MAADLIPDIFTPGPTPDENTVITDYWLDFVAAREETEEPLANRTQNLAQDLNAKVEEPSPRIETKGPSSTEFPASQECRRSGPKSDVSGARRNSSFAEWLHNSFLYSAFQKFREMRARIGNP